MDRRKFIKFAGGAGLSATIFTHQRFGLAAAAEDKPLILVTFGAPGGWDPAFLFTPKPAPISPFNMADVKQFGPFTVAPSSAMLADFVRTYQNQMLVLNGVHSGTNDHFVASRYLGSGRITEGFPHIGALWAAIAGGGRDLAFTTKVGGFTATENLIPMSPLLERSQFETLIGGAGNPEDDIQASLIAAVAKSRRDRRDANLRLTKRDRRQLANFRTFRDVQGELSKVPVIIKDLEMNLPIANPNSALTETITGSVQPALAYCAANLTVSVAFGAGFFDTHWDHNKLHPEAITLAFQALDYFLRGAAHLGFADRVVLAITSDFGRSPVYGDSGGSGKSHWPVGSAVLMGPGIPGGRVVGHIDDTMNAVKVNASTLKLDDQGVMLKPEHIHMVLREVLGITDHKLSQAYPIVADRIKLLG